MPPGVEIIKTTVAIKEATDVALLLELGVLYQQGTVQKRLGARRGLKLNYQPV